jgi:hypothetical protein
MNSDSFRFLSRPFAAFGLAVLAVGSARAATYLPLPDQELARRAPVIVRARVVEQETRLASEDGRDIVVTATRFEPLEVIKGSIEAEIFTIELPGGVWRDLSTWVPGTPSFGAGQEVLLFIAPSASDPGLFGLTEFGLSKFDVVEDRAGRRFAARTAFLAEEDDFLSGRGDAGVSGVPARHSLRDAESFGSALRACASGGDFPAVLYALPDGVTRPPDAVVPAWVNIGGTEGGNRLYRWFWDTGRSPAARVSPIGTQSGLTDGSDGLAFVENAATQWAGVPGAAVRYSPTSGTAQVVVNLDVASHSSYWSEPLPCASGGIIGLGGPGAASSAGTFKGDGNYYAATSGNVWMRKVTGGCYSWQTFGTAVLHELGHTLGLGHSDQATSIHSTTTAAEWSSAVMVSAVTPSAPSTPQADDIQAILWLYGSSAASPPLPDRPRPLLSTRRLPR